MNTEDNQNIEALLNVYYSIYNASIVVRKQEVENLVKYAEQLINTSYGE